MVFSRGDGEQGICWRIGEEEGDRGDLWEVGKKLSSFPLPRIPRAPCFLFPILSKPMQRRERQGSVSFSLFCAELIFFD